jgi:predicted transcriptional regulator
MQNDINLPDHLSRFGWRERELLRSIYQRGGATLREIHDDLRDAPKLTGGVRTILGRLVAKGVVRKRRTGFDREAVFYPAFTNAEVQLRALERIVRLHFGGSRRNAIEALARMAAEGEQRDIAA